MASPPMLVINPDSYTVTFQFRSDPDESIPVFSLSSANNWSIEEMKLSKSPSDGMQGPCFRTSFVVPRDTTAISYKFRYGDSEYFWDTKCPTGEFDQPVLAKQ